MPVQPARIEAGAIGSLKVKLIVSFCSSRPVVEPPFVVATAVPYGARSIARPATIAEVVERPALSVTRARRS